MEACLAAVETSVKGTVPSCGGEAPSNLCETKTEGNRLDLERTKWGDLVRKRARPRAEFEPRQWRPGAQNPPN
jgi:hypothetical protein